MKFRAHSSRSGRRAARLLVALFAGLMLAPATANETIYRCEREDGSVVFSDRPCDEQATVYRAGNNLSVVDAPKRLAERIEENRAFIDQRRERLLEQRRSAEPATERAEQPRPQSSPQQPLLQVPYWPPQPIEPPTPQPPGGREPSPGDDRFSALSGPFPGTIRRRDASARDPDAQ